jgi:nucleoside-diphosphate-sugar epimerase
VRVLLTGVAGFIGRRVDETLVGEGHEVRGLDWTRDPTTWVIQIA